MFKLYKKVIYSFFIFISISISISISLTVIYFAVKEYNYNDLKIGSFNVQVLGKKKISDLNVLLVLSNIIKKYDIIFIQELRDKDGIAIKKLLNEVNKNTLNKYSLLISDRLGSSNSKEQYVFFYRSDVIDSVESFQYQGTFTDFERDPYSVKFIVGKNNFVLSGIHVDPDKVIKEINNLDIVVSDLEDRFNTTNIIIIGDLNADCSYISSIKLNELYLRRDKNYTWHINDDMDTTVGKTDCSYDRIISYKKISDLVYDANIYYFDKDLNLSYEDTKKVSDHYPVEFKLKLKDD